MKTRIYSFKVLAILAGTLIIADVLCQESLLPERRVIDSKAKTPDKVYEEGSVLLTSGIINASIPDGGDYMWTSLVFDDVPADAYVTTVDYGFVIDDKGDPDDFFCKDYEVWLDNLAQGGTGQYICVYDNLGGTDGNDGGYDDDGPDDSDIYVAYRSTDAFYGDPVKTIWSFYVEDNLVFYSGKLETCYLVIYWETPKPNLTFTTPAGWSYPLVVSSVLGTHTDGPDLVAGQTSLFDFSLLLEDQDITTPFYADIFVDGGLYYTRAFEDGMAQDFLYTESDIGFIITQGYHEVCVLLDWDGLIDESNEDDNEYCRNLYWRYPTPDIPELTGPANYLTCTETNVTLDWEAATNAGNYYVQVDDNDDFSSPFATATAILPTELLVEDLAPNTTYYWRVCGSNYDGQGPWSETWQFSTRMADPGSHDLIAPENAVTCQPVNTTLEWSAAEYAAEYQYQVAIDFDFLTIKYEGAAGGTSVTLSDLDENTTYYWRIRAVNECMAYGPWSEIRSFVTGLAGMETPELASPPDNSEDMDLSLTLSWNPVTGATTYQLQVADNAAFNAPVVNETVINGISYDVSALENGILYYWRVGAAAECASSDWSDAWKFTTVGEEVPPSFTEAYSAQYSLKQNYPNPFMTTTTIGFAIPAEGNVRIEFIDMQGKVIESHTGYYTAGAHSITFNGTFQPGIYIYRMKTNKFTDSKLCVVR